MADINDLLVRIDATTEQLRREMKRAEQSVDGGAKRIDGAAARVEKSFNRMSNGAKTARNAVAAVVSALAIRRMASFVQNQIEAVDAIAKGSQVAGLGAEQYQELMFAMTRLTDATERQINQGFGRFNKELGDAIEGSQRAQDAFKRLGVAITDNNGGLRETGEVLDDALVGLAAIESDSIRAARAADIFGDRFGPKIAAAAGQGIRGLEELRKVARESGRVLSQELVDDGAKLKDVMTDIRATMDAEMARAVLENADAITALAQAIARASSASVRGAAHITSFMKWVGEELASAVNGIASDDIVRLEERLGVVRGELTSLDSVWAGPSPGRDAHEARLKAEEQQLLALIELSKQHRTEAAKDPAKKPQSSMVDPADAAELKKREQAAKRLIESTRTQVERLTAALAEAKSLAASGLFGSDEERVIGSITAALEDAKLEASGFKEEIQQAKSMYEASLTPAEKLNEQLRIAKELMESGAFSAAGVDGAAVIANLEREASGFNEAIKEAEGYFDSTRTSAEKLAAEIKRVKELAAGGFFAEAGIDDAEIIDRLQRQLEELNNTNKKAAQEMGWAFSSAFENAVIGGNKLRDVLKGLLQDVMRIMIRNAITAPLGAALGDMFQPRAAGGPVSAGTGYVVGEKGPEFFMPKTSGTIIPNNKLQAASSASVTFNIDARGADAQLTRALPAILEGFGQRIKSDIAESSNRRRGMR